MDPIVPWSFAVARAHVNANKEGQIFVLAFNELKDKNVLCCSLKKLQEEHPFGLVEEDISYRAEPGAPIPSTVV